MKNSNILINVSLLSIFLLLSGSSFAQTTFTNFIAFGDSLSDTGNINSGLPNLPSPFYQNRISNGPIGADYIAQSIGFTATASERGGSNYAVAGANIVGSDREDLASQIDDYLSDTADKADPRALYFVLMGGNDIRGLRSQTSREMAEARINEVISAYMLQLGRLSSAGGSTIFSY
jgi:phospholipase/lecithinase/hemolysin